MFFYFNFKEVTKAVEDLSVQYIKHPLEDAWTLWYYENDRGKDWEANQKMIVTFSTCEDFWRFVLFYFFFVLNYLAMKVCVIILIKYASSSSLQKLVSVEKFPSINKYVMPCINPSKI